MSPEFNKPPNHAPSKLKSNKSMTTIAKSTSMIDKIKVQALPALADQGVGIVGALGANAVLKGKADTLLINGACAIAAPVAATMVENKLAKAALKGFGWFAGIKFLLKLVNGTGLKGLGSENPEEKGVKFIPENVKVKLRQFIPNLGNSDDEEIVPAAIRVEPVDMEEFPNIAGMLKNRQWSQKASIKDRYGRPVQNNGMNLRCQVAGVDIDFANLF